MKSYHPDDIGGLADNELIIRLNQCLENFDYFNKKLADIIASDESREAIINYIDLQKYWRAELKLINEKIKIAIT